MSIPQVIPKLGHGTDPCVLANRWGITNELARRLMMMAARLEFPISIISGMRTAAHQLSLARQGRPAASIETSTHLSCPATGADVQPQIAVVMAVKARLGAEGIFAGLRWGGNDGCPPGTCNEIGIPNDWRHFDLGRRRLS